MIGLSLPEEILGQLDTLKHCLARTLHGCCVYPTVRGETFCLEHSNSARAKRLRDRLLVISRRELSQRFKEGGEFAWPDETGRYINKQEAERRARESIDRLQGEPPRPEPPSAPAEEEDDRQLKPRLTPTSEQIERAFAARPTEEAQSWGETAMSYFAAEDMREHHRISEHLRREQAQFLLREIYDIRREQRREARRRTRDEDESEVFQVHFQGDISTPYGLVSAADGLARLYALGRIPQRRFESMLRSLRIISFGRILGTARPRDFPVAPKMTPGRSESLDADTRPYELRRQELRMVRRNLGRAIRKKSELVDGPEDEPDDLEKSKPDPSGLLSH